MTPRSTPIYNPLPNGLHGYWTRRALAVGKHVLCEKPLTANAAEAAELARAAQASDKILMEAFHYRYHPLIDRLLAIIDDGQLGAIRHIEAHLCAPNFRRHDIRYRYDLAGGATMDMGCYPIHLIRTLAGAEPRVTHAEALCTGRDRLVDRAMTADLTFGDGRTGRIICSMWSRRVLDSSAIVVGERGELRVRNPFLPHLYHRLRLRSDGQTATEHVAGDSTYTHQLRAFSAAVRPARPSPPRRKTQSPTCASLTTCIWPRGCRCATLRRYNHAIDRREAADSALLGDKSRLRGGEQASYEQAQITQERTAAPLEKVQSALWLLGLAFLFWRGKIFPGILVLVALSAIFQAAITVYVKNQATVQTQQEVARAILARTLPELRRPHQHFDGDLARTPNRRMSVLRIDGQGHRRAGTRRDDRNGMTAPP